MTPPNPWSLRPGNLVQLAKLGLGFLKLGHDGQKAVEILTGAATPILDRWFESEQLKVTLATDAIIGAMASPSMPGTAYVLFHHVMGECDGVRGVWGYVRGGMGGISNAIAAAARESRAPRSGPTPRWRKILVKNGTVQGVALRGRHRAPRHAGGLRRGRERHLPQADGRTATCRRSSWTRCATSTTQRELQDQHRPRASCPTSRPCRAPRRGPQHRGTIHISPTMEYIERAYDDAKYGRPSQAADHRGDDPLGSRRHAGARRAST